MFLYSVWQVRADLALHGADKSCLQVFYLYIQYTVIDHDPELVTSLRYLTQVINTLWTNIVLIKLSSSVLKIPSTSSPWMSASAWEY